MKSLRLIAIAGFALVAAGVGGQTSTAPTEQGTNAFTKVTVITSDRLTFDYKKHFAHFEQNVLVTDPEMQLTADQMTVTFDDSGAAKVIKAEGRVTITQTNKTAQSKVATYDVATGKIVLAGQPRVTRGRDVLEGDVITYWRNQNRMICQPRARLIIYPQEGGLKDVIGGE
jgi:lipopolysaccharide export system protein LptA